MCMLKRLSYHLPFWAELYYSYLPRNNKCISIAKRPKLIPHIMEGIKTLRTVSIHSHVGIPWSSCTSCVSDSQSGKGIIPFQCYPYLVS